MATKEESVDFLKQMMEDIQLSINQLNASATSNHIKLNKLQHKTSSILAQMSVNSVAEKTQATPEEKSMESMKLLITAKEKEIEYLKEEREGSVRELQQLNDALEVLSADHMSLESEIKKREELQAEIISLKEIILQRDTLISQLQIENTRVKAESGTLLKEFALAIKADEETYGVEEAL